MDLYTAHLHGDQLRHALPAHEGLIVACYCAAWCRACQQYAPDFQALAQKWPTLQFVWIDIEESPELLGDEDVEDFPTLLVQGPRGNHFFGPLLPHIEHLDRLLATMSADAPVVGEGPPPLTALLAAQA